MVSSAFESTTQRHGPDTDPSVTERDERIYWQLVARELTPEQRERVLTPEASYPRQRSVLALHWHAEHVPVELVRSRIDALFPQREQELIIPTDHNVLTTYGPYTGVEVDCHSVSFNRKVQLLIHFANEKLEGRGDVFRAMLGHTFGYRQSQLFELLDSLTDPAHQRRVQTAAERTGADDELVAFVRAHAQRLRSLLDRHEPDTPRDALKNKLLRDYLDAVRDSHDGRFVDHAQAFLKSVKGIVKREFTLEYFYRTEEIIEEARSLGAGIVIPHPEQFWPILLEDLDVDGIEVWNPASFEYTRFLIEVVDRRNRERRRERPLLLTMGDDCHVGEKVKDPAHQDRKKASREIGVQPPWDDLAVRKGLIVANASRPSVIEQYRERLH